MRCGSVGSIANIAEGVISNQPTPILLNDTVWDDLRLAGSSLGAGASAPDSAALIGGIVVPHFDGNAILEQLYFQVQMPHTWKQGSAIYPHVHWVSSSTGTGTVVWNMEYSV